MRYGYCVNMLAQDGFGVGYDWIPILKEAGFDYVDLPMAQMMQMDDGSFRARVLSVLRETGLPCVCVNNLFPAAVRLTGPQASQEDALDYCRRAFARAAELGARRAVFGSSGARNVPPGWPRVEAERQLVELLCKLAPLALEHGITLVIEPLNRGESNVITSIADGVRLCDSVSSEAVRMLADFYHMALSGERAEEVARAGASLRHVHIARPLGRGLPLPGDGEDYAAFCGAQRAVGYDGDVSIEAYAPENTAEAVKDSLAYLKSF